MIDAYNREVEGLDDVEIWIHTCWGNPNMQRVREDTSYAASIELYLERCKGDVWTVEMKDRGFQDIDLFDRFKHDLKKKVAIGAVSHRTLQADRPEEVAQRNPPCARAHPAGAVDCLQRLRLRPSGVQPGDCLLQGFRAGPRVQYRPQRVGVGDHLRPCRRSSLADRYCPSPLTARVAAIARLSGRRSRKRLFSAKRHLDSRGALPRG